MGADVRGSMEPLRKAELNAKGRRGAKMREGFEPALGRKVRMVDFVCSQLALRAEGAAARDARVFGFAK